MIKILIKIIIIMQLEVGVIVIRWYKLIILIQTLDRVGAIPLKMYLTQRVVVVHGANLVNSNKVQVGAVVEDKMNKERVVDIVEEVEVVVLEGGIEVVDFEEEIVVVEVDIEEVIVVVIEVVVVEIVVVIEIEVIEINFKMVEGILFLKRPNHRGGDLLRFKKRNKVVDGDQLLHKKHNKVVDGDQLRHKKHNKVVDGDQLRHWHRKHNQVDGNLPQ